MLGMDADYADQSSVNIFRFSGGCASLVAMVLLSIDAGSSETTFNSSWNCKVLPWRVAHADQSSVNIFGYLATVPLWWQWFPLLFTSMAQLAEAFSCRVALDTMLQLVSQPLRPGGRQPYNGCPFGGGGCRPFLTRPSKFSSHVVVAAVLKLKVAMLYKEI